MTPRPAALGLALLVAASACATPLAPEHETRNRELLAIAQDCQRQHPGVVSIDIEPHGWLNAVYKDSMTESGTPFMQCYGPKAEPLIYSRGAFSSGRTFHRATRSPSK
jgi:hypothetical protein